MKKRIGIILLALIFFILLALILSLLIWVTCIIFDWKIGMPVWGIGFAFALIIVTAMYLIEEGE